MPDRIVRVPLPISLIREMDRVILGQMAGFETRAEFVREAIQNLIVELSYPDAPPESPHKAGKGSQEEVSTSLSLTPHVATLAHGPTSLRHDPDVAGSTSLVAPRLGFSLDHGVEVVDRSEPLYGLHNRDYPSIWATARLVEMASRGPIPFIGSGSADGFLPVLVAEAWRYGERLADIGRAVGTKLTYLFPTNQSKPQSAAANFEAFAVGSVTERKDGGGWKADGPLFAWRLAHLIDSGGVPMIGASPEAGDLLGRLDGISALEPHEYRHSRVFLQHLRTHGPGDFWGFQTVLELADDATRPELLEALWKSRGDWTEAQLTTNAAGFIARLREWGLIETKQLEGRYRLTEVGRTFQKEWTEDS